MVAKLQPPRCLTSAHRKSYKHCVNRPPSGCIKRPARPHLIRRIFSFNSINTPGPVFKGVLTDSAGPRLVDVRIQIITALIQSEYYRDLHLKELARSVNLSPSRLRHLFKQHTGQTLVQYLMHMRMQQARLLLETTQLSVKEIMNRVGINDDSHFARDFKRVYGVAPSKHRNQSFSHAIASPAKK